MLHTWSWSLTSSWPGSPSSRGRSRQRWRSRRGAGWQHRRWCCCRPRRWGSPSLLSVMPACLACLGTPGWLYGWMDGGPRKSAVWCEGGLLNGGLRPRQTKASRDSGADKTDGMPYVAARDVMLVSDCRSEREPAGDCRMMRQKEDGRRAACLLGGGRDEEPMMRRELLLVEEKEPRTQTSSRWFGDG